jgi:hypothetical protein
LHRLFRTAKKKKCHPISRWHADELAACFRRPKAFRVSDDLIQFLEQLNLLVDQQLRITDHID